MEKIIILGGGVAGLSCLNALLDRGITPLLLETGTIGTPKMCGEFLAPIAAKQLQSWGIGPIQSIHQGEFRINNKKITVPFSKPAGAFSRCEAEIQLAQRAYQLGGRIREKIIIQDFSCAQENTPHTFYLNEEEIIQADTIIFATGKYQLSKKKPRLPYFGFKFHFLDATQSNTLVMYSLKNAYLGMVPIGNNVINCACLVKREVIEKAGSCKNYFLDIMTNIKELKKNFTLDGSTLSWYETPAPEFQLKNIPLWPKSYWIGDALASLHPAIGSGFAHSICSAVLAADFYLRNDTMGYHQAIMQQIKWKRRIGKILHHLLLNPTLGEFTSSLLQLQPQLINQLVRSLF